MLSNTAKDWEVALETPSRDLSNPTQFACPEVFSPVCTREVPFQLLSSKPISFVGDYVSPESTL